MLEGQGTAGSSEAGAGGEASTTPGPSGSPGTGSSGGGGAASLASGDGGSAPAVAGDAVAGVAGQAPVASPAAVAAKFRFADREWESQAQAEAAWKANLGRNWEGKLRERDTQLAQRDAELQALRQALANGGGQGQGTQRGAERTPSVDPDAPLAQRAIQSGDIAFLTSLLNEQEGEAPGTGVQRFTVGLLDTIDKAVNQTLERHFSENVQPFFVRQQQERTVASAIGVARSLAQEFPELDEGNASPEAVEHQQAFVEILKQFPPEQIAQNPELYMRTAAYEARRLHGTPTFATPPGTSGSPSAAAVAASAAAFGAPDPLSGSGTPRPRPNGQPESAEERIRRENAAVPGEFVSPSGRRLGFGPAV